MRYSENVGKMEVGRKKFTTLPEEMEPCNRKIMEDAEVQKWKDIMARLRKME